MGGQISGFKRQSLRAGAWSLFGVWTFGVWDFSPGPLIEN
jgi:hypothetical protein